MKRKTATPKERFFQRIDALVKSEQWKEIDEESAAYLESDGSCTDALFLLALAAAARRDYASAVTHAKAAFDADPGAVEYCDLLATLHGIAGDLNSATFYAKMASVGTSMPQRAGWLPKSLPTFTEAFFEARQRPFLQQAMAALSQGLWVDAEHWFGQHLAFHPRDGEAHLGLANSLMIRGLHVAAVESLRAARHAVPADAKVASLLGSALAAVGQYAEAHAVHRAAKAAGADSPVIHAAAIGDLLPDPAAEPETIAAEIRDWAQRFAVKPDALPPGRRKGSSRRLTVGYVIGGLPRSGQARALADILVRHNTQRFRIVGFGAGQLADSYNIVFQKCVDGWADSRGVDPLTFASMVRAENVDILVDVSGFLSPSLFRAFGARMAPLQIVWSPSHYGMAPENVDALLTDGFLDPIDREPTVAGETIWRLEKGGPVVELVSKAPAAGAGVDDRVPVFAADATLAELNVPTVEAWADILAAVPDAVLLLRDHDFRNEDVTKRLIGLFGNFGLAHRIDVVTASQTAEFLAQADVCLIPYQSMRPEVAVEALAAGLPVVSWSGAGRHRRIVGSVLHFAGLAEDMAAENAVDYCAKAVAWMADPARREAFRQSAHERLATSPIFDGTARAADLEAAYLKLHETIVVGAGLA